MRSLLSLIFVLSCSVVAWAQPAVTILPDRILTGHGNREFFPRFSTYLPNSLTVPAGQTVTLNGAREYDGIEVAGTLRCDGLTLRVTHLVVLPGATLDCGPGNVIVIRNVPIDTARDPYQFGNGVINAGRVKWGGGPFVQPRADLTADAVAGATELQMVVPESWKVGDEVFVPDLRQMRRSRWPTEHVAPRRHQRLVIAAKTATSITVSVPLDFEIAAIRDPAGAVRENAFVLNLTRSTVVMSESPTDTRGHIIMLGHQATWDVQGVAFVDLGRTRTEDLDSTTADASGTITHVGTNQVGRYSFHIHHTHGVGSILKDSVLVSTGGSRAKWAVAVHATHDTRVEDNIAIGFEGAGFVVEDGYETRNIFRGNYAAFSLGNNIDAKGNVFPPHNCPGCEGAGFWIAGPKNTFDGNVAVNNFIGFQMFYMTAKTGQAPKTPGGPLDTTVDPTVELPVSFAGNHGHANLNAGYEGWRTPRGLIARDLHVSNNGFAQVVMGGGEAGHFTVEGLYAFAQNEKTIGIETSAAYHAALTVDGGEIRGMLTGVYEAKRVFHLKNVILQNVTNIDQWFFRPDDGRYENVTHLPLGSHPKRFLVFGQGQDWSGNLTDPLPTFDAGPLPPTGARTRVVNWQGSGKDYLIYENQQKRSKPAWPAQQQHKYSGYMYIPEAGITMGEGWDKYGLAYGGGVVADSDAETLDGLLNGVGAAGLTQPPLPPARLVLTLPNPMTPAAVQKDGSVMLWLAATGQFKGTNGWGRLQVDGGKVLRIDTFAGETAGIHYYRSTAVSPGPHTVVTWREDADGDVIQGSRMSFRYIVGDVTPPTPSSSPSAAGLESAKRQ